MRSVVSVFLLSTAIASIGCGGASDSKAGKNARPRLGGAVLNGSKERIAALLEAGALPVDINASALTKHTLSVPGVVSSFDSTEVQHLVLMPGVAYSLESSEGTFGAFTVTADGNINYDDAALSYIFSGKGTTTLSVKAVFIQLATGQLTKQSISVRGVGDPFTSGGGFHNVKLAPGLTYHLTSPIRGEEFGAFTVTRFGSIELDPASSGSLTVNGDDILSLTAVTITVDATMLTKLQLEVRAVGDAFDSKEQRQFKLAPGQAYAIYSGVIGYLGIFNVTSVGKIQFEPSLNATFGLRDNDTTLVVKGVEIFIDAHLLTKQRLTVYGFGDGFDSKGPPYSVTLPPGGALYSFGVWSPVQGVLGSFHVSADGTVNYDPPFDAVFSGRGTNTLVLNAFPVMIDARQLPQQTLSFLNIGDAFDSKTVTRFMLSPSTPYTLYSPVHGFLGVFILRPNGTLDFDHLLDGSFSGRGDTTLTLLAEPTAVIIDATELSQQKLAFSPSDSVIPTGAPTEIYATPGTYTLKATGLSDVSFEVKRYNIVEYNPALEGILTGTGTNTLHVHGRHVTIHAAGLSQSKLQIPMVGQPLEFDTHSDADLVLLPAHGYQFAVGSGMLSDLRFDLDVAGQVHVGSEFAGVASVPAPSTLAVTGASVAITPHMTNTSVIIAGLYGNGVVLTTGEDNDVSLLPLASGSQYKLLVGTGEVSTFGFNLDRNGQFVYESLFDGYVQGRGSSTLLIDAPTITIDASPTDSGAFQIGNLFGVAGFDASRIQSLQLIPVEGGYEYNDGTNSFVFTLDEAGVIHFDASLNDRMSGSGTTSLVAAATTCNGRTPAENDALSAFGGWMLPSLTCSANDSPLIAQATPVSSPGKVTPTGASPLIAPRAIAGNSSRRSRRPHTAGGDPVLGDGEFFLQRTDVSFSGPGGGGLHYQFKRSYRSGVTFSDGGLGPSWDHNFHKRLVGNDALGVPYCGSAILQHEIGRPPSGHGYVGIPSIDYYDGELNVVRFTAVSPEGPCVGTNTPGITATGDGTCVQTFEPPLGSTVKLSHYYKWTTSVCPGPTCQASYASSVGWLMTDSDGNTIHFDVGGRLYSIINPAGNGLLFTWDSTRLTSVWDGARRYFYNYWSRTVAHGVKKYGNLQCVSLSDKCGTDAQPDPSVLVYFRYNGEPTDYTPPQLSQVSVGSSTKGESYQYYGAGLGPVLQPTDCLAQSDLTESCGRLCLQFFPSNPESCSNLDYAHEVTGNPAAQKWGKCQRMKCPGPVPENRDPSVYCEWQEPTNGFDSPVDSFCMQWYHQLPNCQLGCMAEHQCNAVIDGHAYGVLAYGTSQALKDNIIEVDDENGVRVARNEYGTIAWDVSYDRVVRQWLGPDTPDEPNEISFYYHDLAIEKLGPLPPGGLFGPNPAWPGPYSTPDATYVVAQDDYVPVSICPQASSSGLGYTAYLPPQTATSGPSFVRPSTAVVVHDLHDVVRTQYYDQKYNLLREVNRIASETTDYNYVNNQLVGVRAASGMRTCNILDSFGKPLEVSVIPAPGYAGDTTPQVTKYQYDPRGQLTNIWYDAAHRPNSTQPNVPAPLSVVYTRDSRERVSQVAYYGAGIPNDHPVTTHQQYDNDPLAPPGIVRETPAIEFLRDGTENDYFGFDPNFGGPTVTTLDVHGAQPKTLYARYDTFGRAYESGERTAKGELFGEQFVYDPVTLRLVQRNHRLNAASPWILKDISSHDSNGYKIDSEIDHGVGRKRLYHYRGQFPEYVDYVPLPGHPPLPASQRTCYHYSPDGQLQDVQLPEGNRVHYEYDAVGRRAGVSKGYPPAGEPLPSWAAACGGVTPPSGDPGMRPVEQIYYSVGGFASITMTNEVRRTITTDGFGRVIQTRGSWVGAINNVSAVAVHQFGYDPQGNTLWEATLLPEFVIGPGSPYRKPTATTPGLMQMVEYTYDVLGRRTVSARWNLQNHESVITTTTYDEANRQVTTKEQVVPWSGTPIDPGRTSIVTSDGLGRVLNRTLPDGSSTATDYGYDDSNQFFAHSVQQTNQTVALTRTYKYDSRGNLTDVFDGNQVPLSLATYDDDSHVLMSQSFGRGAAGTTTNTYDKFGRLTHTHVDLLNGTTTDTAFGWDRNDRKTGYVDAENHYWRTTLSGLDQPLEVDGPASLIDGMPISWTKYSYFGAHLAKMDDSTGHHECYRYDEDFRPTYVYGPGCTSASTLVDLVTPLPLIERRRVEYTPLGQTVRVMEHVADGMARPADATVSYDYDSLGRTLRQTVDSGATAIPSYVIEHVYTDATQTVTTSVMPNPMATQPSSMMLFASYAHHTDALGRLQTVTLGGQPLATYDYGSPGMGGPRWISYANGTKASFTYDAKLRQTGIDVDAGGGARLASLHEALGADAVARMRQWRIGPGSTMTDVFRVDGDGRVTDENLRLSQVTLPQGEVGNDAVAAYMQPGSANLRNYTIDNIGNWKTVATSAGSAVYDQDELSRLNTVNGQAVTRDEQDNLLAVAGQAAPQFGFEPFSGLMVSASDATTTNQYAYDGAGRRALETPSNGAPAVAFLWDGPSLIAHGEVATLTLDVPADDVDGHIASVDASGGRLFYHQGPEQSVLAVTDGSGALIEGYTYSAFGELRVWGADGASRGTNSAIGNRFLFQGQLYDSLTETYSMRAREYQPRWGRFLSPDPLSVGAAPSLYSFTGGRPLQARDPDGLRYTPPHWRSGCFACGASGVFGREDIWSFFGYHAGPTGPGDMEREGFWGEMGGPGWDSWREDALAHAAGINRSSDAKAELDKVLAASPGDASLTPGDIADSPAKAYSLGIPPFGLLDGRLKLEGRLGGPRLASNGGLPDGYQSTGSWDAVMHFLEVQSVDHPVRTGLAIFGAALAIDASIYAGAEIYGVMAGGGATTIAAGTGTLGAAAPRIIQSGGNIISSRAGTVLNELAELNLSPREWGRALEALKKYEGLANNFHGLIDSLGNYLHPQTKEVLGNLFDYL